MHFASGLLLSLAGSALAAPTPEQLKLRRQEPSSKYAVKEPPLDTPWTYELGTNPWPEYPRPQLAREHWQNLNGIWKYQRAADRDAVRSPPPVDSITEEVMIPSCLEIGLSGIQGTDTHHSWFSTSFTVPEDWADQNVLLNFAAVDYEATVLVNGKEAGFHRGGYFAFTLDITELVNRDGDNELLVFVFDPTDALDDFIPIGKQTVIPHHIFYRPCSGIWQSVWLEKAPANFITQLDVNADMDGKVKVTAHSSGEEAPIKVVIHELDSDKEELASQEGNSNSEFEFDVSSPELWSPGSPNLYDLTVTMGDDVVRSYTGFRTISKANVNGIERATLNGDVIFQFGTLDQGYWPDGLHTPPNREAMVYDLEVLKKLGFNTVRKHIKVEPPLFYRACDEMGLLVIQDMPSLAPQKDLQPNPEQQAEFARQLDVLVNQFKSYPSISTWVIYNEGWGQITDDSHPEFQLTDRVRELDPTRLIDSVSGWFDNGAGDYHDNHHYATPQCATPFFTPENTPYDEKRIGIQGEFGGIGQNVSIDHLWNVKEAIDKIDETYELHETVEDWNRRGHTILQQLRDQIELYACSGGIWTQTTDVEGEVNGLMTYDRRILRVDEKQWQEDIKSLYDTAADRAKR